MLPEHLKALLVYYIRSTPVWIMSSHSLDESQLRLLALGRNGKLTVRARKNGEIIVFANAHAIFCRGMPIIPILTCTFREKNGRAFLEGTIAIDRGVKLVLGFMALMIFVFFPLGGLLTESANEVFPCGLLLGMTIFVGLLELGYSLGREDINVITRIISDVLAESKHE